MKKILLLLLLSPLSLLAQLHDNTWFFGYNNNPDTTDSKGVTVLTFPDANLKIEQNPLVPLNFDMTNTSFSDSSGQLFCYTNGIHIGQKNWEIMENGDFLNLDYSEDLGVIWPQWFLILPVPGKDDSLIFFHESYNFTVDLDVHVDSIQLGVINKIYNAGLGKVLLRDGLLIADTLAVGKLTATRHANGQDWWMLVNEKKANRFYRYLISPSGVELVGSQTIGLPVMDGVGQSAFSPDGTKYAIFNAYSFTEGNYTDVYDFDRCTGLLSNHRQIHTITNNGYWGGLAFSPNSRYLYVTEQIICSQYDTEAADIEASRKIVAEYDGYLSPFPAQFFTMQIAPDGKIYVSTPSGTDVLHVIDTPDEEWPIVRQHAIQLPTRNSLSIPTFPNYRLGPVDGSACDTLGIDNLPIAWWRSDRDTVDVLRVLFHDLSYYEPDTWSWDFGDPASGLENSSSLRHPEHVFSGPGDYEVCLTVSNANASHTLCRTLHFATSYAQDPEVLSRIQVGPNPFGRQLNLTVSTVLPSPHFYLYDVQGQLVREHRPVYGVNELTTSDLPPGMYFWLLTSRGERVQSGKVVKVE
jgi:hypothetical protein